MRTRTFSRMTTSCFTIQDVSVLLPDERLTTFTFFQLFDLSAKLQDDSTVGLLVEFEVVHLLHEASDCVCGSIFGSLVSLDLPLEVLQLLGFGVLVFAICTICVANVSMATDGGKRTTHTPFLFLCIQPQLQVIHY